jgi:hypothetical protein
MATIRRELNWNFIRWSPVDVGAARFTSCSPIEWDHEVYEAEEKVVVGKTGDVVPAAWQSQEPTEAERLAMQELLLLTPSNEQLRRLAAKSPPPDKWFEEEEEPPF